MKQTEFDLDGGTPIENAISKLKRSVKKGKKNKKEKPVQKSNGISTEPHKRWLHPDEISSNFDKLVKRFTTNC